MLSSLRQFVSEEEGVDALEYGILGALIFLVILAAVTATANEATEMFTTISTAMTG
jgi:pilus assembly protein Flp/PilA